MPQELEAKEGTVTWLNDTGLVLDNEKGPDGKYVYLNFSKPEYRDKVWDDIGKGDHVKLGMRGDWVQAIKLISHDDVGTNAGIAQDKQHRSSGFRTPENMNRADALRFAVDAHVGRPGEYTDADIALTFEFFMTLLQPSKSVEEEMPFA